jgi:hypothetical protein
MSQDKPLEYVQSGVRFFVGSDDIPELSICNFGFVHILSMT